MARRRIDEVEGLPAVKAAAAALGDDSPVDRTTTATAVRFLLQLLAEREPGNTLEVRVPPFGAVQCVEGPRHTRGTPPNVIEMPAEVWLALATGRLSWEDGVAAGRVHASGTRADLAGHLPILPA